ncbi:MAG: thymidine kinase [Aeromicrobium sp.]
MRGPGSLHVITGCMFSGKTEELLRLLRRASVGGRTVLLIRPKADTRSEAEVAESRSGARFACTSVDGAADIVAAVMAAPCEVVAIDEAEMFGVELAPVADRLATDGFEVIVSGLDTDFAGRPFGPMPTLLALADSVAKLTAVCTFPGCGSDATRSQRLVNNEPAAIDDPIIVIGGTESGRQPDRYEARCRTHHRVAPPRQRAAIPVNGSQEQHPSDVDLLSITREPG